MDNTEKLIIELIDNSRDKIIALAKSIKGEKGFFEFNTADKMKNAFLELGIPVRAGLARTGVRADKQYTSGAKVAIVGELDGVACPSHPLANPENGVAHACGHSAQLAAIYGAAIALCDEKVAKELSGTAVFFAVPCEEFVPISQELIDDGITESAGKPELIKLHEFDDIDVSLVNHIHMMNVSEPLCLGMNVCCGFVAKTVTIHGVAAHAAGAPHLGVNALSAASLALNAIGLLRETFKESDCIRIHTNITKGGTALNVVPDEIEVKAMIRGLTNEAIEAAANKFDTAFEHCALAIGARAQIATEKGYIPTRFLGEHPLQRRAASALDIDTGTVRPEINFASTDVGFLAEIMPVLAFTHGGGKGALHSANFEIINEDEAYIMPAKMFALQAYQLLRHGAEGVMELKSEFDKEGRLPIG